MYDTIEEINWNADVGIVLNNGVFIFVEGSKDLISAEPLDDDLMDIMVGEGTTEHLYIKISDISAIYECDASKQNPIIHMNSEGLRKDE